MTTRGRYVVLAWLTDYPLASTLYGPFPSIRHAESWATVNVTGKAWEVKPLHKIDKHGEVDPDGT